VITISPSAFEDLALASLIQRVRQFMSEESASFARTDPEFQQVFLATQLHQMAEFGLESEEALPSLALASWSLGLIRLAERPDLAAPLSGGSRQTEAARLSHFRDLVGAELNRRALGGVRSH
jgi:hypothetical protein